MSRAVDRCIADGLLADILSKNKAEVVALFLTEYDEQAQRELDREEAREEGLAEGLAKGEALKLIRIVKKKVLKGITAEDTAEMLEEPLERIQQIYNVIREHADWTEDEIYDRTAAALPGGLFFSNASEE